MPTARHLALLLLLLPASAVQADPPMASYLFPAGGQRGSTVRVRVGGLYLYERCPWELLGPGVKASSFLTRIRTRWFEGPLLPIPDSQRAEDYPQDLAGTVTVAADAPLGPRHGRLWTSEGAHGGLTFVVGALPEIIENEIDGDPVPVPVTLPVTINGRVFPREDLDIWSFTARKGQVITAEVHAARIGSPLDSRLEVRGPIGLVVAENDDARGTDSLVQFTAPIDGTYQVRIHDSQRSGGQAFVYRLTLTAGPFVTHLYPLGGQRGSRTRFHLGGLGLPHQPVEIALPRSGPARFPVGGQQTQPVDLDLDDLRESLESEPNDTGASAATVPVPGIANGRIDRAGDIDLWRFRGKKGESVHIELRASVLGSPLQGVLELLDPTGKSLHQIEATGTGDPSLLFAVPADGNYLIRIRDRFRLRGGPAFAYRLRLTHPTSDFALELPVSTLRLVRGQKVNLPVRLVRHGGFHAPVTLTVTGLPEGVKGSPATIPAGQIQTNVSLVAGRDAAIAPARIQVRGTALIGKEKHTRTARLMGAVAAPPVEDVLLAVALVAPFKVTGSYDLRLAPRGTVFRKRYQIERNGYTGPLEVRLADRQTRHLQGVTGPVLTIPAEVNTFDYPVTLPPWMETGRTSRSCIMVIGRLHDGEKEHTVSYTSQAQNDQIIAVVETGRLGVELGRTSVAGRSGGSVEVPVSIRRGKGLKGTVQVELVVPEGVTGVSARPVVLAAKETAGTLRVQLQRDGGAPLTLVVRATLTTPQGAVTAEATLEVMVEK